MARKLLYSQLLGIDVTAQHETNINVMLFHQAYRSITVITAIFRVLQMHVMGLLAQIRLLS